MAEAIGNAWSIGPIAINTTEGWIRIPGWSNGTFGLDWRPHDSLHGAAYVVTHLGSGWSAFAILANLEEVQALVDKMQSRFDWTGGDIETIRERIDERRAELFQFIDGNGGMNPAEFCAPAGHHAIHDCGGSS